MSGFNSHEALKSAVDIVSAALGSGSIKLHGPANHLGEKLEASKASAEADSAYLEILISKLAAKLTEG
jgi:hypothetical protein